MTTLTKVLEVNWIILYFVYGQVFFIMGLVAGLKWRRQSRLELAHSLPWLAAFGIAHGLTEWGYIFIPLQALYLEDTVVRVAVIAHLLLMAMSFFFLFQFAIELLLPLSPGRRWPRAVPTALLVLWAVAILLRAVMMADPLNTLVVIGDGWSRYLLCLPASLLAFLGLLRQATQMREMQLQQISFYLTGAAIAFLGYAIVAGLVVPTAPIFPANLLNYALLDRTIHLPIPVLRSLCGLAMVFFIVRSLDVFRAETDRRIAEMEQAQMLTADRERIGRELHDGIIQNIYAAGLSLERMQRRMTGEPQRAQQLQAVLKILNRTIRDIRNYIFDLQAEELPHPLEKVLENLVRDLRIDTLLEVNLNVAGQCCWQMTPQQVAHLTQIAREALSNVVQHAQAEHVTVDLQYNKDSVCLTVADDGQGAVLQTLDRGRGSGQGIANMQDRARQLGGELSLESRPGHGMRLSATVPCPDGSNRAENNGGGEHEDPAGR